MIALIVRAEYEVSTDAKGMPLSLLYMQTQGNNIEMVGNSHRREAIFLRGARGGSYNFLPHFPDSREDLMVRTILLPAR